MKKIFVVLVVFMATAAGAQEEIPTTNTRYRYVRDGSSEYNRINKSFSFTAQLLGSGPNPVSAQGLGFSFFMDRNSMILFDITKGQVNGYNAFSSSSILNANNKTKSQSFGIHYKQFVSNTFYFRTGMDIRSLSYSYTYSSILFSETSNNRYSFDSESTSLNFAIGNQWQFETFTLGCDWFGVVVPIGAKFSNVVYNTDNAYSQRDLEEDQNRLVKDNNLQLLRFYLGATF